MISSSRKRLLRNSFSEKIFVWTRQFTVVLHSVHMAVSSVRGPGWCKYDTNFPYLTPVPDLSLTVCSKWNGTRMVCVVHGFRRALRTINASFRFLVLFVNNKCPCTWDHFCKQQNWQILLMEFSWIQFLLMNDIKIVGWPARMHWVTPAILNDVTIKTVV